MILSLLFITVCNASLGTFFSDVLSSLKHLFTGVPDTSPENPLAAFTTVGDIDWTLVNKSTQTNADSKCYVMAHVRALGVTGWRVEKVSSEVAEKTEECLIMHTVKVSGPLPNKNLDYANEVAHRWPVGEYRNCGVVALVPDVLKVLCHPDKATRNLEEK